MSIFSNISLAAKENIVMKLAILRRFNPWKTRILSVEETLAHQWDASLVDEDEFVTRLRETRTSDLFAKLGLILSR